MTEDVPQTDLATEAWYSYMTTGRMPESIPQPWYQKPLLRPLVRRLPADPRCRICHNPFEGFGGRVLNLVGVERSRLNPYLCNLCEQMAEAFPGGAEVEASILFADVRGSTSIAEGMSASQFSQVIDRFYRAATHAIFQHAGMVEKLIGDEVNGFFVPGIAGEHHAQAALAAAKDILRATGHLAPEGPWVPVGIGVHTGEVYVGTVGEKGHNLDIAILGDNVNTAARLASAARAGEIILSEATRTAAEPTDQALQPLRLNLKGKQEPFDAWSLQLV